MDSERVLVMDAGTVVEFDHPYNLLKNKDGFLYKMVEQTGIITSELLHTMASEVLYNYLFFLTAFLWLLLYICLEF